MSEEFYDEAVNSIKSGLKSKILFQKGFAATILNDDWLLTLQVKKFVSRVFLLCRSAGIQPNNEYLTGRKKLLLAASS